MTRQDRTELADQLRDVAGLLEANEMVAARAKLTDFLGNLARREVTGRARTAIGVSLKDVLSKVGIKVDWTPDE